MMEIQYAIFCEGVQFPDKLEGKIVVTHPISAPTLRKATVVQLNMPLFVTFVNGSAGSNHNLEVIAKGSSGDVIITRVFKFKWLETSVVQAECFIFELPEIHNSDTLTFSFILDGKPQCETKIPFRIMG
jgi:hypothetical protein